MRESCLYPNSSLSVPGRRLLAAPGLARSTGGFHWERLHVAHVEPTEVFARLGLTHITRYGYTRGQKKDPDPMFPPGLTDVVPYDAGHTLLVRGTPQGVALFRQRVAAADVARPPLAALADLLRRDGDDYRVLAGHNQEVVADTPLAVAFDTTGQFPQYQVRVRVNRDGSLAVTCRTALPLATPPTGATTVLVPTQVWTPPVTKDVRPGDTLTFDDLAAARAAARQKLGQPPGDSPTTTRCGCRSRRNRPPPAPMEIPPSGRRHEPTPSCPCWPRPTPGNR